MTDPRHDWDHYYGADDDDGGYGEAHDADACDHIEFELGFDGRAHCVDCCASWTATDAEVRAFEAAQQRWRAEQERWERRERWAAPWLRVAAWFRRGCALSPFGHAQGPFQPDDEIPF